MTETAKLNMSPDAESSPGMEGCAGLGNCFGEGEEDGQAREAAVGCENEDLSKVTNGGQFGRVGCESVGDLRILGEVRGD